jgi:hypothetical protein
MEKWLREQEAKKEGTITAGEYFNEKQEAELEDRYKKYLNDQALEEIKKIDQWKAENSRANYYARKMRDGGTIYEMLVWDLCYKGIRTDNPEGLYIAERIAKSGHHFDDQKWIEFLHF